MAPFAVVLANESIALPLNAVFCVVASAKTIILETVTLPVTVKSPANVPVVLANALFAFANAAHAALFAVVIFVF